MDIKNSFLTQMAKGDITNLLQANNNNLALNFNCVRIGIVQEFYPTNLTALVKIASKRVLKINANGTQTVRDYAPIIAKVCYSSPYETHPLKAGDEVVLLFNDREIETWFINGQANAQNHERMHDLTDAIALVGGIRSLPRMIEILLDCLHLFYGNSDIQLKEEEIISNTPSLTVNVENAITTNADTTTINNSDATNINSDSEINLLTSTFDLKAQVIHTDGIFGHAGDITASGTITGNVLVDETAYTGTFKDKDGKTVTVVNGIIRSVT